MDLLLGTAHPLWSHPSSSFDPWPLIGAAIVLVLLTRSFGMRFGVLPCAIALASGPPIATSVDAIGIAPTVAALLALRWIIRDALRRRSLRPPDTV